MSELQQDMSGLTEDDIPVLTLPTTGGTLFIDNSSLERFTTCERAAQYYLLDKRETADTKWALRYGHVIHTALELRYRNPTWVRNGLDDHLVAAQYQLLASEFDAIPAPENDHRNYNYAMEMVDKYNGDHPSEPFKVLTHPESGEPLVEVPFAIPLGTISLPAPIWCWNTDDPESDPYQSQEIPIVWTGKIDLIYQLEGMTYIMDHKTTSIMGSTFFQEFELAQQMYGYVWAAQQMLGIKVDGYAVNAIATRRITKTGKGVETARKFYYADPGQLEEWQADVTTHITTFLMRLVQQYFPKGTKWCMGKYGQCPYWDVCVLPPDTRMNALYSNTYQDVTWDPLKK